MKALRLLPLLAVLLLASSCATDPNKFLEVHRGDIYITGGDVVDGTGGPARKANVLIRDGQINYVGPEKRQWGPTSVDFPEVIDASGKYVAPGFIDTHAHGEPTETPAFENFLAQGVTTICLGQDGSSPPIAEMEKWMADVAALPPGPNIALFAGHGTIRDESGAKLSENPSAEQLAKMRELSARAMELGCFGLTTGLEYQPGMFSRAAELGAIAEPVGAKGGIVMSHMRTEDDDQLAASLKELIDQGVASHSAVHVSHIKSVYGKGAPRAEEILKLMQDAREKGETVTADIYPYEASFTGLSILFPKWALPPNDYKDVVANRHDELSTYMKQRIAKRNGPSATLFGSGPDAGKTLEQVAKEKSKPYEEVLIDKGPDGGSAAYFIMDEALQSRLLVDPHINICSDGSPDMRHPRGYGSFAKIIRYYVNEKKLLTLEEAVHKMSGLPATTIGLIDQKRGELHEGWAADVVIFDPAKVKDTATFEKPMTLAQGFDVVIVNGKIARKDGVFTKDFAGRMLKKK